MNSASKFAKTLSYSSSSSGSDKPETRILIGDGALGTELMKSDRKNINSPLEFNLHAPSEVRRIHRRYLNAGCRLINTNTFCANSLYLEKQGLAEKVGEINLRGAGLAEEARADYKAYQQKDKEIIITGSVGPTGSETAIFLDEQENRKKVQKTFLEQIKYLKRGGVDIITLETFSYHRELKLAAEAAEEADMPYFMNMTMTDPEKTEYGSTIEDLADIAEDADEEKLLAVGLNCLTPDQKFRTAWRSLANQLDFNLPIALLYNAGAPELDTDQGKMIYPQDEGFFEEYQEFISFMKGYDCIIGGCCGTTPETIEKLKDLFKTS
ncbi:homocysteine S-methyltransferase family protein [Halarsenatibacter silvermanii]|uniref:Methionine synthase I (Cobalamin-dependent), methyltransferase domain n=1 Tax=Halarsenatibacter silvermanii TaxID=321763 RepID=A0A1G9PR03_9FIRM|nr:homocysteine S-methyltransferase family protein [Halarsenatibacter silvermanii]SDM01180.1 Methionine synthase I (cobalamin-dependent), methyltransferase domain [Halarsenatibacter silvermanii]